MLDKYGCQSCEISLHENAEFKFVYICLNLIKFGIVLICILRKFVLYHSRII